MGRKQWGRIKRRICIRASKNFTRGMQPRGNSRLEERGDFFLRLESAFLHTRARVCMCVCVCVYLTLLSREYIAAVTSIASLIDIIVALRRRERITGDGYSYGILMKAITGEYMPLISRLRLRTRCKKPRIALGKRRARAKRGREGERERKRETDLNPTWNSTNFPIFFTA